ncbi:hypothetical protein BBG47_26885 [Paenibacillus sp. KS1]|jgi:hypothetical protein|uniref:imm11 family protein n=1 Tax=Paenibacillus sp. KS1 TaxID=1849249 RepID=UPI000806615D|nr:hypothetical protein [Paenibacillus sp. KS1]OBY76476.1 hypothetical protein BBG47_26885 [Paenibacillus sp. KS1]
MRDYYVLLADERIDRKVEPVSQELQGKDFEKLIAITVADAKEYTGRQGEYVDWLEYPLRMASERMKVILERYHLGLRAKRVDLIDRKRGEQHMYWAMHIPELDCLSPESEFHPNRQLKKLVLDKERVKHHHLFTVAGIREPYVIVSLEAAESLLRRGLSGFVLRKVELAEGAAR